MTSRAVGYVRVSSEEQVEGLSLDAQRHEIAAWCEQHDHRLIAYYADEGLSAYSDQIGKRPAFADMLGEAERGGFDVVVVRDLSRFARRSSVQSVAFERLGRAGVGFVSLKESIDLNTPSGKLMLTMMGGINEFQSAQTGLHVSASHAERARRGLPPGPVPFGYVVDEAGGVPRLEESNARAVREAFSRRADGATYSSIAVWLNAAGFQTTQGRAFTSWAVKDLLANRFYLGFVRHKRDEYAGQHEAIIDEELFERVQRRRFVGRSPRAALTARGALVGRIRCGRCIRALWSDVANTGRPLYREQHGQPCETAGRSVPAPAIDEQIGTIFGALELRPGVRESVLEELTAAHQGIDVRGLQAMRTRLARAYADGAFSDVEYEARMREIHRQLDRAIPMKVPVVERLLELLDNLPEVWGEAAYQERREIVASLLQQVYVDVSARRVAAVAPTAAFRMLLENAIRTVAGAPVSLVGPDKRLHAAPIAAPNATKTSPTLVGLVETGEN